MWLLRKRSQAEEDLRRGLQVLDTLVALLEEYGADEHYMPTTSELSGFGLIASTLASSHYRVIHLCETLSRRR